MLHSQSQAVPVGLEAVGDQRADQVVSLEGRGIRLVDRSIALEEEESCRSAGRLEVAAQHSLVD